MTDETLKTRLVLLSLVAAFTKDAAKLELEVQEGTGSKLWILKGGREDEGALVGKQGSHVRALSFLVKTIGHARDERHTLKLITEHEPEFRAAMAKNLARSHDAQPAAALLSMVLAELSIGDYIVEATPKIAGCPSANPAEPLAFELKIHVREFVDYNALTVAPFPDAGDKMKDETIVGALGTLFRAIAKRAGVRYDIVIARA